MQTVDRQQSIERGSVNLETGEFPMILASEGEASDGHILSIAGLDVPERMPLLFGHASSPDIPALGSVIQPTKSRDGDGIAIQRAVGSFNLAGDDPLSGVRRGIAQLVADGDLSAVSIRWTGEGKPRVDLPKDHPHHVARAADGPSRFGMWFEKSKGLEGSIVAIGSDSKALSGRADHAEDDVTRMFFRALAGTPEERGMRDLTDAFKALATAREAFETAGVDASSLLRLLGCELDEELIRIGYGDERSALVPSGAYWQIQAGATEMRDEAFRLVTATSLRALNPQEITPTNSPAGEPDANARAEADGSREVEVTERVHERKPGTVNDMSEGELGKILSRTLTDAVYKLTGRR